MNNSRSERIQKFLMIGALALPVVIVLAVVLLRGSNAPFWDEWDMLSLYRKMHEGGISAAEYFEIHMTNHRCVVPITLEFLIWKLTHGNDIVVLAAMQLFLVVALVAIVRYWKKKALPLIALLPAVVPIFSLKHGYMIMWTSCMLWPCCTMFAILSLYAFYRSNEEREQHGRRWFLLSMLFGVLASFSAANGLLLWITYVVIFVAQALFEKKKLVTRRNVAVVLIGCLCFAEFFRGGTLADNAKYRTNSLEDLLELFVQLFANPVFEVGAGWATYIFGAIIISILILVAFWICRKKLISEYFFPISIIVFSLGSMFIVACSRGGLWEVSDVAVSSQYAMYPAWLYVGVFLLGFELLLGRYGKRHLNIISGISVALYIFLMIISLGKYDVVNTYGQWSQAAAYALQHWEEVPQQVILDRVFPRMADGFGDPLEDNVRWIKENKLFLFAHDKQYEYPYDDYVFAEIDHNFSLPETEEAPGSVWIDYINDAPVSGDTMTLEAQTGLDIMGWALDDAHAACPSSVYVKIVDNFYKMKIMPRESVVDYFDNSDYLNSGFQGYVSTSSLAPGTYEADIVVISADGQSYYEKPIVIFEIT